jgi:hypothetical protein
VSELFLPFLFSFVAPQFWQVTNLLFLARPLRAFVVLAYFGEITGGFKGKEWKGRNLLVLAAGRGYQGELLIKSGDMVNCG